MAINKIIIFDKCDEIVYSSLEHIIQPKNIVLRNSSNVKRGFKLIITCPRFFQGY